MTTTLFIDDGILAAPSLRHAEQFLGLAGLGGKRKITWGPLKSTLAMGIDFKVVYTSEHATHGVHEPASLRHHHPSAL